MEKLTEQKLLSWGFENIDDGLYRWYYFDDLCMDIEKVSFSEVQYPSKIGISLYTFLLGYGCFTMDAMEAIVDLNPINAYTSRNYPLVIELSDGSYYAVFDFKDVNVQLNK